MGRFHTQDPLADIISNVTMTPYNYCSNAPINRIDPDGRDDWKVVNNKLTLIRQTEDKFHRIFMVDNIGKEVPYCRTDNKYIGDKGKFLRGWDNFQRRSHFAFLFGLKKNREAATLMMERAVEEYFGDDLLTFIQSTDDLNSLMTRGGEGHWASLLYDSYKLLRDNQGLKDKKQAQSKKEAEEYFNNKNEKTELLLKSAKNGELEEGKYVWDGKKWVKE